MMSRVSIRKTFAISEGLNIFFAIFAEQDANVSFFEHQFCAKKQQFAQFAKVISRKIALFRFCETQVLRNSANRVLRNSAIQTVGDGVCFLEFNSGKILFWNVFL